jgi:hypothetical protein
MNTSISKKLLLLLIVCMAGLPVLSQKQILQLDTAQNYRSESFMDKFVYSANPVLFYEVVYDKPNHFDNTFAFVLAIEMIDTVALRKAEILNIALDTGIVKCHYFYRTPSTLMTHMLNPEILPATMIGTIRIVDWKNDSIEFDFDIAIKEGTRKGFLFYQGQKRISRLKRTDLGVSFKDTITQ